MADKQKAVLTALSDPLSGKRTEETEKLAVLLAREGLSVTLSGFLTDPEAWRKGREKASELNRFLADPEVRFIFDVSGGDLANTVLPHIDYEAAASSGAVFFGYSDLTAVLNALAAKSGMQTVNYQVRNLLYSHADEQLAYFREHILPCRFSGKDLTVRMIRGDRMQGPLYGGNIRCFRKLSGTPYMPDLAGAVLLLEAFGGGLYQMASMLASLSQEGILSEIGGVLLGTFTKMEEKDVRPGVPELILDYLPEDLPVGLTRYIGHGTDARAAVIGKEYTFPV